MALIHAELGERETAAAMVEQLAAPGFSKFRHDMLFLPGLARLALACADLADSDHAEAIYDLLRPYAGRVVIVGAPAHACWGPVDHYLGVLATLGDRPDWAADHFEAALIGALGWALPRCSPRRDSSSARCCWRSSDRIPRPGAHVARRARGERRRRSACNE